MVWGRGISPIEMSFFNIDVQQSRDMFREALDAMTSALASGKLAFQGRYFSFKNVELQIEPYQRPYPPLWYPTNSNESMQWLAQEGFNTVVHYQSMPAIRELFELYRRVWKEHADDRNRLNAHVTEPLYGISRHVYIGKTDAQAWEEAKAALAQFNENTGYLQSKLAITGEKNIWTTSRRVAPKDSISRALRIRCGRKWKTSRDHRQQLFRRIFLLRQPDYGAGDEFPALVRR